MEYVLKQYAHLNIHAHKFVHKSCKDVLALALVAALAAFTAVAGCSHSNFSVFFKRFEAYTLTPYAIRGESI